MSSAKVTINITNNQIIEAAKDTLLNERCEKVTRDLLASGVSIDKICMFVRDYQRKYMYIKQEGGDCNAFTFKVWWQLGQRGEGKFALAK
jgi:hypothetical protein